MNDLNMLPIKTATDPKSRRTLIEAVRVSAALKAAAGPRAARSQDFLYSDDGLPANPASSCPSPP